MANKKSVEKNMSEVYVLCHGLGPGRLPTIKQLNEGNVVDVNMTPNKATGKIEVFLTNGQRIGYIMSSDENAFGMLKKKEPPINTVMSAEELIDKLEGETKATAVSAASVSVIKIRVNIDESVQKSPSKSVEAEPEVEIDTSSFSKEDEQQVKLRVDYLKKILKFPAKVRNNIIAAFVNFMSTHNDIKEFNPTFINNNGIMETAVKNILCGNNLALTGPKGVGKNVLVEHLSNLFDLTLCDMQMSYDTAKEEVR